MCIRDRANSGVYAFEKTYGRKICLFSKTMQFSFRLIFTPRCGDYLPTCFEIIATCQNNCTLVIFVRIGRCEGMKSMAFVLEHTV